MELQVILLPALVFMNDDNGPYSFSSVKLFNRHFLSLDSMASPPLCALEHGT